MVLLPLSNSLLVASDIYFLHHRHLINNAVIYMITTRHTFFIRLSCVALNASFKSPGRFGFNMWQKRTVDVDSHRIIFTDSLDTLRWPQYQWLCRAPIRDVEWDQRNEDLDVGLPLSFQAHPSAILMFRARILPLCLLRQAEELSGFFHHCV